MVGMRGFEPQPLFEIIRDTYRVAPLMHHLQADETLILEMENGGILLTPYPVFRHSKTELRSTYSTTQKLILM